MILHFRLITTCNNTDCDEWVKITRDFCIMFSSFLHRRYTRTDRCVSIFVGGSNIKLTLTRDIY